MPRTGRPKPELILSAEEREQLTRWSRRAKASQALALRSKIVLACAEGIDNKTAAEQLRAQAAHPVAAPPRRDRFAGRPLPRVKAAPTPSHRSSRVLMATAVAPIIKKDQGQRAQITATRRM